MANAIKQRITLEGVDEVNKQFDDLGAGFAKAVAGIESAGSVINNLVQAVAVGVGAFIGLGAAIFAVTKSASSALDGIDSLATRMGSAAEEVGGLQSALVASGASVDEIGSGFKNLARNVFQQWPEIQKQIRGAGDAATTAKLNVERASQGIATAELNVKSALLAVSQTQTELGRIDQEISDQRVRNALNVRSAQLSLVDAQDRLNFLLTGERRDPESQRDLDIAKAKLAVQQAREQLAEAQRKKEQEAADAAARRAQVELAAEQAKQQVITARLQQEQAILQLSLARKAATELEANSIQTLQRFVGNLANGFREVGTNVNASADNIAKGFIANIGAASNKLKELGGSMEGLANASPDMAKVIEKLADVLHATGDEALNTAILSKLLGKNVSTEMVQGLSQGSAGLRRIRQELADLGLALTKPEIDAGARFTKSFNVLTGTLALIKDKIGAIFAPLAADIFEGLTSSLRNSATTILGLFAELRTRVEPFLRELPGLLLGFGRSILQFFTQTLPTAFGALRTVLDGVAGLFTKLTGIRLSGDQLGIGLLVGQFLGLNQVLLGIIGLVTNIGILLIGLALINPFGALVIAAFAAGAAIVLFWDSIKAGAQTAWVAIKKGAALLFGDLVNIVSSIPQALVGAFNQLVQGIAVVWEAIKAGASAAWDLIVQGAAAIPNLIAQAISGLSDILTAPFRAAAEAIIGIWQRVLDFISSVKRLGATATEIPGTGGAGESNPFASGGYVRGPGTGTSDSIFARLSNGEFVMRADAVRRYGIGFMAAINGLRFPAFSMGGIVDGLQGSMARNFAIPRFAAGGLAVAGSGGMHPVTINFNGKSITGLSASGDALGELQRASIAAQLSSTGKKPRWVR